MILRQEHYLSDIQDDLKPAEIVTGQRILAIPLEKYLLHLLHQLSLGLGTAEDVVWSYAGLTQVDTLGPQNPPGSYLHVRAEIVSTNQK